MEVGTLMTKGKAEREKKKEKLNQDKRKLGNQGVYFT